MPSPCLKLATNTAMFDRMDQDMDINCGTVVDNGDSIETVGQRIFDRLIEVASGDPTKSEVYGFGDDEFVPWQIGAVM